MRRAAGMIRYPHDRQHREPAVSKRDGIPAVGAGSWPVRCHQPAHAMSAHCDWRGDAALPSDPLPTAAPGSRCRAVVRLVADRLHHAAVVVGAVPCRPASLLAGHSRLDRAGGRGVTRQGRSASVAAEHRLGAPPDGVIAVCHDIASAPRRVFRTALSRSLSVHTVPRRMPVLPVTTTPSRLLDGDSQGLEA